MHQLKTNLQIFVMLFMAAGALVLLSVVLGAGLQLPAAAAQAPMGTLTPSPIILSDEARVRFMEALGPSVQASTFNYSLAVSKTTASAAPVQAGGQVNFTITITNNAATAAPGVMFQDDVPLQMYDVSYQFGALQVISDGVASKPTWLLLSAIPSRQSVKFTVTGKITTTRQSEVVTNLVKVSAAFSQTMLVLAQAGVVVENPNATEILTYLPLVGRAPTPTPTPTPTVTPTPSAVLVYSQEWNSSSGTGWITSDLDKLFDGCTGSISSGRYNVNVESNSDKRECLPFGPSGATRTYGEFETSGYWSEGSGDASMGIFINGAGGETYYYYRIWVNRGCPGNTNWELRKRNGQDDEDDSTVLLSGCSSLIQTGTGTKFHYLKIRHESNGKLSPEVTA